LNAYSGGARPHLRRPSCATNVLVQGVHVAEPAPVSGLVHKPTSAPPDKRTHP